MSRSLPASSQAGLRTQVNQTLPHMWKWATVENARPEFRGFLYLTWDPTTPPLHFRVVLRRLSDLRANIFRMKRAVDKRNKG